MDDVAAVAGVSRGTVSRALRGGEKVSAAAMRAIHAAVKETGYVVNRHARSLASRRSGTVALVLCAPPARLGEDPSFNILLFGCVQALSERGISVSLSVAGGDAERGRLKEQLAGVQVDGALVIATHPLDSLAEELATHGIPTVTCGTASAAGRRPDPRRPLSVVSTDDRDGARNLVRYLRGTGRRTIATIAGPPDTECGASRLAGWRDVVGADASDDLVAVGDYTRDSGHAAMVELLRRVPDLDAVFVASDLMAAGALAALHAAGRRVPDDVAVGGFEDSAVAVTVQPTLTTVRRPLERISTEMVRLLLAQIDGEPPAHVVLPTGLVLRDSA